MLTVQKAMHYTSIIKCIDIKCFFSYRFGERWHKQLSDEEEIRG